MLSQYVCSAEANNDLSSAICSRMSICLFHVEITDKISIEAFTTLLQTQAVSVRELDLRRAELREEDWHLRGKPGLIGWVGISRENLRRAAVGCLGCHKVEYCGLQHAYMHFGFCAEGVQKPRYDCWENAWAKLKQKALPALIFQIY